MKRDIFFWIDKWDKKETLFGKLWDTNKIKKNRIRMEGNEINDKIIGN